MTRTRWLALGVLAIVAVAAAVLSQRGPAHVAVDTVRATRQARFVSTVTTSGEIVATRYADIGSSVMGKIVSLPVAEGERVRAGQVLARIDADPDVADREFAQRLGISHHAADEPETVPKMPHARTLTCMRRPGSHPSHGASPSNISSESRVR